MPITVIDKIKQKNNQDFKLLDASDINWDIDIPSSSLPDDVYTKTQTDAAIASAVAGAGHLSRSVVEELPPTGADNVIYMVSKLDGGSQNVYEEYMYINGQFEKIGTSEVDLSNYVTNASLTSRLEGYATTESLDSYLTKEAASSTYLTEGDLADYATSSALQETLTQAKQYADSQDAATLQAAKAYTDTEKAKWNAKAENTVATVIANGLMSAADKVKLDGIEAGANNYVHPNDSNTRHVTDEQIETWTNKADTTLVSTTENGLMSKTDKAKLDGIEISKIENITYTMPATEFTSASKVKIPVSNITVDTVITIGLDTTSLTVEQYNAAGEAKFNPKIVDGGVEVSCFGQLPKIDIPVTLAVVRK